MIVGNTQHVAAFLEFGRGHYREALDYIIENTPAGTPVTLGSDNDFRNGMVISYYLRLTPPARNVIYIKEQDWTSAAPYWIIVHDFDQEPFPAITLRSDKNGVVYRLVDRQFRHAGASGWNWFVYRKA